MIPFSLLDCKEVIIEESRDVVSASRASIMDERGNENTGLQGENEGDKQEQQQAYYSQQMQPMPQAIPQAPYGYHVVPQWIAQNQMYAQQLYHQQQMFRYHFPLQAHMEGVPLPPGIPGLGGSTDPLEAVLGPFPCARLRNLPYDITLEDILILLQGLVVIDVVIVGGGDAFVIFANPMDFQMALQRNRQTLGRRFIDISASSRAEYYEAVATMHEQERGPKLSTGVGLRVDEGLRHSNISREESHPIEEASSSVATLWGQSASSPPTIQSISPQPGFVDTMLLHSSGVLSMGNRSTGSASAGGQGRAGLHAPAQKRAGGGMQVGEHTGFLRMRGLPFSATKDEIFKFFAGYNPVLESIVLTYRNDGRATGEAYIGFQSPDDSKRAMELHRRSMGSRYIELFISNKDEQGRALARFGNR